MATRFSNLAWRIPWTEGPGRLQSMGSTRVRHDSATKPTNQKTNKGLISKIYKQLTNITQHQKINSAFKIIGIRAKEILVQRRQTDGQQASCSIHITNYLVPSVTQLCLTLCDPMNRSIPGLPVHHQLPESTQTHVH